MNKLLSGVCVSATMVIAACSSSSGSSAADDGGALSDATGGNDGSLDAAGDAIGTNDSSASDTGTTDAGPMSVDAQAPTVTSECSSYAAAVCTLDSTCDTNAIQTTYSGSMATCEAIVGVDCTIREQAAGSGWTSSVISACTTYDTGRSCTEYTVPSSTNPCSAAGTGAAGSACAVNDQCASRACTADGANGCGMCESVGALAAACGGTTNVACAIGDSCTNGVCVTIVGNAATCDATHVCTTGLDCVLATAGATSGTCTPLVTTAGTACNTGDVVAARCSGALGLFCDATSHCTALTYVAPGAACGEPDAGTSYAVCTDDSRCTAGVCTATLTAGAPCVVGMAPRCGADTQCIATADGGTAGHCLYIDSTDCH